MQVINDRFAFQLGIRIFSSNDIQFLSPFRTSRTRSDLNLALKFLLVRDMFFESSMLVVLSISNSLKTVLKSV